MDLVGCEKSTVGAVCDNEPEISASGELQGGDCIEDDSKAIIESLVCNKDLLDLLDRAIGLYVVDRGRLADDIIHKLVENTALRLQNADLSQANEALRVQNAALRMMLLKHGARGA